jgi:ubiquinone/menaquinone biosynthesis C-methylase UbiE
MPSMYEIYDKFAANYDELINCEDYKNNLNEYLLTEFDWTGKSVFEIGVGTGRVTDIYIDKVDCVLAADRSPHMIDKAKNSLKNYNSKIDFRIIDNNNIPVLEEQYDIFIEGWSLGHTFNDNFGRHKDFLKTTLKNIRKSVKAGGLLIIIETLGTMLDKPICSGNLHELYKLLKNEYNFRKTIIKTDYKFKNYKEAARIMGFFFGKDMKDNILEAEITIIPEFTGVWSV